MFKVIRSLGPRQFLATTTSRTIPHLVIRNMSDIKPPASPLLALPSSETATKDGQTTLSVGSTVSMDALGPVVVNVDGTMSRINNWAEMNEIEKQNTLRILGKRNKQRREALLAKAAAEDGDKGVDST